MEAVEELLPHRPPMVLIDAVETFDAEKRALTARVTVTPEQVFHFRDAARGPGVPNWAAVEYMAQASAALVGIFDKSQGRAARPGLLLGTRRLELGLEIFEEGRTYRVTAVNAFQDSDAAAFECRIEDDTGARVAEATLNAYRPPDMERFLKENTAE